MKGRMKRRKGSTHSVSRKVSGAGSPRLDAAVRERFSLSWTQARERIERGKIWVGGTQILDIGYPLAANVEFEFIVDTPVRRLPDSLLPADALRHLDREIVVVDKPAGLLTVPFNPDDRDTLDRLLRGLLAKRAGGTGRSANTAVHVVHRLDKGTSGLLVFARTLVARDLLKDQFRQHSVHRRYLALVHGHVASTTVRSHLVRDRGDGTRGSLEKASPRSRRKLGQGRVAITHVESLEQLSETTLIACRLETGRTNQIRIHLAELGHPLVGETVYRRVAGRSTAATPRLCLHAAELGFVHPRTHEPLMFRSEIPAAMQQQIDARRTSAQTRPGP